SAARQDTVQHLSPWLNRIGVKDRDVTVSPVSNGFLKTILRTGINCFLLVVAMAGICRSCYMADMLTILKRWWIYLDLPIYSHLSTRYLTIGNRLWNAG